MFVLCRNSFNFDGLESESQNVDGDEPRLMLCTTESESSTTSTALVTEPKCSWGEKLPQTYLNGCTADYCFAYVVGFSLTTLVGSESFIVQLLSLGTRH